MLKTVAQSFRLALIATGLLGVVACSSTGSKPDPKPLAPIANAGFSVGSAWSSNYGEWASDVQPKVVGDAVAVATKNGTVAVLNGQGQELWRVDTGAELTTMPGFDGRWAAVISKNNDLIVSEAGQVLWKQNLGVQTYTTPLVAGNRVFVLTGDRKVIAFDAAGGAPLWKRQRIQETLVLQYPVLLAAYRNHLIMGLSGDVVAYNPNSGTEQWYVGMAKSRSTNEIEQLVDLVGKHYRNGDVVCARSFQTAVSCANLKEEQLLWSKRANGFHGVDGDGERVFAVDSNGMVTARNSNDGEIAWLNDNLLFRSLSSPSRFKDVVAVGDAEGYVHFLSRTTGKMVHRVSTGSGVRVSPVEISGKLLVLTDSGAVQVYQ